MSGKGDKLRPASVDKDTYASNYERTFGKKDPPWVKQLKEKDDASKRSNPDQGDDGAIGD